MVKVLCFKHAVIVLLTYMLTFVESTGRPLEISINNKPLKLINDKTNPNILLNRYEYKTGEIIDFKCETTSKSGNLQLEYYDANNATIFGTTPFLGTHRFTATMQLSHNNSFAICNYTYAKSKNTVMSSIIFTIDQQAHIEKLRLTVNNMTLVETEHIDNLTIYEYRFVASDNLIITCEKAISTIEETLTFYLRRKYNSMNVNYGDIKYYNPNKHTIAFTNVDNSLINITLYWYLDKSIAVQLNFVEEQIVKNDVRIAGLAPRNIEYQYSFSANIWRVHYSYSGNEILNLTCLTKYFSNNIALNWFLEDNIIDGSLSRLGIYDVTDVNFVLNSTYNMSKLVCRITRQNKDLNNYSAYEEVVFQLKPSSDPELTDSDGLVMEMSILVVIIILIIAILATIVYMVYRRRAKLSDNNTQIENDDIPPYPRQWNLNHTTRDELIDATAYSAHHSSPRNNRQKAKNDNNEITYASLDFTEHNRKKANNNVKNPKDQLKIQTGDTTYAEIMIQPKVDVQDTSDIYENVTKESNYANCEEFSEPIYSNEIK